VKDSPKSNAHTIWSDGISGEQTIVTYIVDALTKSNQVHRRLCLRLANSSFLHECPGHFHHTSPRIVTDPRLPYISRPSDLAETGRNRSLLVIPRISCQNVTMELSANWAFVLGRCWDSILLL
jgi:hypothetical protein